MSQPIGAVFRRHVLSICENEGLTFEETAQRCSVGIASVTRWARQPAPKATREDPRAVQHDWHAGGRYQWIGALPGDLLLSVGLTNVDAELFNP